MSRSVPGLRVDDDPSTMKIFLSYSGDDSLEASLLQYAIECMLAPREAIVWTYQRDQGTDQRMVAASIKDQVRQSDALIFMVSRTTLSSGATQWMELAYADAYNVRTFVLLHHLTYDELLRSEVGVPPLLLAAQCNPATDWKRVVEDLSKATSRSG